MVKKRERENPCFVCGHYHKFEDGEVCGVCGHRPQDAAERSPVETPSAFATEILPSFLYLGSYDNASRAELLKAQGISRILNTVPTCQNLYKNSFMYKTMKGDQNLPFDECVEFIEQSRLENAPVLIHCMSGQNRSPAVVIAYLMRYKGWRLAESYQWVKDRKPSINLSPGMAQQLQAYEAKVFGSSNSQAQPTASDLGAPVFSFGFPTPPAGSNPLVFSNSTAVASSSSSFLSFGQGNGSTNQGHFIFGAAREEQEVGAGKNSNMDSTMDN